MKKVVTGSVFEIELPSRRYGYGVALESPLVGYLSIFSQKPATQSDFLEERKYAFKVWTHRAAFKNANWRPIGKLELSAVDLQPPMFFRNDVGSGRAFRYPGDTKGPGLSREQCISMECAAVWDSIHIEERLDDYFDGRPNIWFESMLP